MLRPLAFEGRVVGAGSSSQENVPFYRPMAAPVIRSPVELIESTIELPAVPSVAAQVVQHLSSPDASAESIGKIISRDQAMTARVLQVANSSLFGGRASVSALKLAVVRMGLSAVRGIVMSLSTKSLFRKFGPLETMMWQHAVATAIGTHVIATHLRSRFRDQAFVAGLMHDVGKVLLVNYDPTTMEEIFREHPEQDRTFEGEQRAFGFTHMDVGALLVRKWQLPETIEHVAFLHHDLSLASMAAGDAVELVYMVSLADDISHSLGMGFACAQEFEMPDHEAMQELGLDRARMDALCLDIREACDSQIGELG